MFSIKEIDSLNTFIKRADLLDIKKEGESLNL